MMRSLPGSSESIPAIGIGTTGMGTAEHHDRAYIDRRITSLLYGIDRGLTFIDTAALYGGGFSETILGEALGDRRRGCFLASKFYPYNHYSAGQVREAVLGSLRRLRTSHLDLIQVHWPNPHADTAEIFGGLDELVREGLVRYVGVSNYCGQELVQAQHHFGATRIVSNQYEFNLLGHSILEDMRRHDLDTLLLAYSPLNQGRLASSPRQRQVIEEIASIRNARPAQVVMAWVLSHRGVGAVARASSIDHVDDLLRAMELGLDDDECGAITAAGSGPPIAVDPVDIELIGTPWRAPYLTLDQAIENALDLIPSPRALADRLLAGALEMPIRLWTKPGGGYVIDSYDPFDQIKKFWAWVIARPGQPMPAYLMS